MAGLNSEKVVKNREGLRIIRKLYEAGEITSVGNRLYQREQAVTYTNQIPLGYLEYEDRDNIPFEDNLLYLDASKPFRLLIFGAPDSGKTWLARGIKDRLSMAGLSPVIFTDISPEYFTSVQPLQPEFKRFLLPFEKPQGFPMKVYYPFFLFANTSYALPAQELFQMSINGIAPDELIKFIGFDDMSLISRMEIEDMFARMLEKKAMFNSIDDIMKFFEKKTDLNKISKFVLLRNFKNLKSLGIFGTEYKQPDIITDINKGIIPDINLFGWQSMNFKKYVALMILILVNQLLMAKQNKQIKQNIHVVGFFEELHQFAPKGRSLSESERITRDVIRKYLSIGRKEDCSFIGVSQTPQMIDPVIIEQSDMIIIPKGFERSKLMEFLRDYMPQLHGDSSYEFGREVFDRMSELRRHKNGNRDFLLLNKAGDLTKFTPLAPLSRHKLVGESYD